MAHNEVLNYLIVNYLELSVSNLEFDHFEISSNFQIM